MAIVDIIDPSTVRISPSSVGTHATAPWLGSTPGLDALGVRAVLQRREIHHVLVFDRGGLVGVLCSCELLLATPTDRLVELMARRVITIDAGESVWTAAKIMSQTGVGCLPVMDSKRVVGMIDRDRLFAAGIPLEATGPICAACGGHRHVPFRTLGRPRLCIDCFDRATFAQLDDDAPLIETGGSG